MLGHLLKHTWLTLRGFYYVGSRYQCPVCGHRFRTMLPGGFNLQVIKEMEIVGAGYRENDICPHCQSTDRDRLVYLYLKKETSFFQDNISVLHIAPEPALYDAIKKVKNVDYHPGTKYQEGFYYDSVIEVVDLMRLSFNDNRFDWILCNHVLEHISDDIMAMKELFRVLKPGGKGILQVPYSTKLERTYEDDRYQSSEEREEHFGQFDHVRIYGQDYADRLKSCGFEVSIVDQKSGLPGVENPEKYALNKKEQLFVVSKPNKADHKL